jgi:exopolyphosphatase/guanosine-5'-triphosphate,3'-diphosphate pyrophosphatase
MQNKTLAAIDIGTNTFRLLIGIVHYDPDKNNYSFKEIASDRRITRLGEGMHESGELSAEAMARGINALKDFSDIISANTVYQTSAVATSALRDAGNSSEFIRQVRDGTGLDINVITGEKEAELTASGILMDMVQPESLLMIDIGGGSTELIFTDNKRTSLMSLNMGVVHLAAKYMKDDPPSADDLKRMEDEITGSLRQGTSELINRITPETVLFGTAGTITALASMAQRLQAYDHDKIHNYRLTISRAKEIFSAISLLTSEERSKHIPFEPSRLDIIVPGTLILLKLMETFRFSDMIVSNYGLREGILIELYRNTFRS